jgi:CDGSH-type Zn-finger protein/uncharacterized Fe-S cluster protein YjdI
MSKKKVLTFEGQDVTVVWDGNLCVHAEECWRADSELFELKRDPFGDPDKVSTEEVDRISRRCPSGAIAWTDNQGQTEEAPEAENTVTVVPGGPLYVRGNLNLVGVPEQAGNTQRRVALCRCGHSKNKPFCDKSHVAAGFDDTGAVGREGPGHADPGGELTITPRKDGSLFLQGNVAIRAASGAIRWRGSKVSLCRCGLSKRMPFCDSSHKGQFEADGES